MLLRLADAFQGLGLERLQARLMGWLDGLWGGVVVNLINHSPVNHIAYNDLMIWLYDLFMGWIWLFNDVYVVPSGELTFCHGKIHHFFHGKIHYFYGHFQLLFVSSPEGTINKPFPSHHHFDGWYVQHSLKWMVYGIVLTTLVILMEVKH